MWINLYTDKAKLLCTRLGALLDEYHSLPDNSIRILVSSNSPIRFAQLGTCFKLSYVRIGLLGVVGPKTIIDTAHVATHA